MSSCAMGGLRAVGVLCLVLLSAVRAQRAVTALCTGGYKSTWRTAHPHTVVAVVGGAAHPCFAGLSGCFPVGPLARGQAHLQLSRRCRAGARRVPIRECANGGCVCVC